MSRRRSAMFLPWVLLAISAGANLVLWQNRATPPVSAPIALAPAPAAPASHFGPMTASALSAVAEPKSAESAAVSNIQLQPAPAQPAAVYRTYVGLVAADLRTAEQVDDLNRVLARWAAIDPAGAGEWLAEREDQPFFAPAAELISSHLVASGNVTLALQWANMIKEPARHAQALQTVCGAAYRAGLMGEAQVRASGLTPERVTSILSGAAID